MNKTAIAKLVVTNLTGFTVGSVTKNFIGNYVPTHENSAVNVLIDVANIVTSFAVAQVVHEHLQPVTDKWIDDAAQSFSDMNITKTSK